MSRMRDEFPAFPFAPYPIQSQLMKAVYSALQKGGVAIVESPTGTGKTLSLICSVLQWLEDRRGSTQSSNEKDTEEPDWMRDFSGSSQPKQNKERVVRRTPITFGGASAAGEKREKKAETPPAGDDDAEFLLQDYDSDDNSNASLKRKQTSLLSSDSSSGSDEEDGDEEPLKVFFSSRTHSQLSQFIHELRRTSFASTLQTIALGSRKTLCINQDVLKLKSSSRINDRCLELQKKNSTQKTGEKKNSKKTKTSGCPYLKKQHRLQKHFKDQVLSSEPKDIEDLVHLGEKLGTCPYYGSRNLLRPANVVVLPYQSLLHASTREALGVNLKDSVVIFDEAHNLADTVTNTYSSQLSGSQLRQVKHQLSEYLTRFRSRLAAGNRRYIQTLLVLVNTLEQRLSKSCSDDGEIMAINEFLFSLEIDNINLFKLCRYMKDSNIANKVSGYGDKYLSSGDQTSNATAGFHALGDFLLSLTTAQTDGRVLILHNVTVGGVFKFLMLDAAKHFSEVVTQARAVILAGGTLQPISELRQRLLFQVPEEKVHLFSCGHIVSGERILPLAVAKGPSGKSFDFTYQSRNSPEMMEELGRVIVNITSIVPEGIVVFFPSFEYESAVHSRWEKSGILTSVSKKKEVFREPRNSTDVEAVLSEYKKTITASTSGSRDGGALMCCVVGGKMSEGINFSDGMGRCVVMVGLPYPSPRDPELVEKIKYVDQLGLSSDSNRKPGPVSSSRASSALQQCGARGKEYYEDLCMKAVNQSIGRAIRHAGDYAAILLLDARYTRCDSRDPASKLPAWIREHLMVVRGGFGEAQRHLHRFFSRLKVYSSGDPM